MKVFLLILSLIYLIAAVLHIEAAFHTHPTCGDLFLFEQSLRDIINIVPFPDGDVVGVGGAFDLTARTVLLTVVELTFENDSFEEQCAVSFDSGVLVGADHGCLLTLERDLFRSFMALRVVKSCVAADVPAISA